MPDTRLTRRTALIGVATLLLPACSSPRQVTAHAMPEPVPLDMDGYRFVPRCGWTDADIGDAGPMNGITRLTVHHTTDPGSWVGQPDIEVVRRIERFHRDQRGWACVGYHHLIGRSGLVFGGRPECFQGAHVLGQNANNLGIALIGDFSQHPPEAVQLTALRALLDDRRRLFAVPRDRVFGHQELHASECPGRYLMEWVRAYRASAPA